MKFEHIPNELLLDLFELFDLVHLLRAFNGLNIRFNQLLFIHFRKYHLDFRSISKYDFEYTCQQYLPFIIHRIISLALSDDDETPHLSDLFLSHGFTFNQFRNLQTLSLYSISSIDILNHLTFQCRHLQHLTHFYLIECDVHCNEQDIRLLMMNIWSISNLIYCNLDCFYDDSYSFTMNSITSQSIEYLIMKNVRLNLSNLSYLFQCTPHLRRLWGIIYCPSKTVQLEYISLSIISLKLIVFGSIDTMKYLLQNIKNLLYLTLETWNIDLNGYEWENILVDILPQIKRFQLKMNFDFKHLNNQEEEVDILLDSFRTQFWIETRQQYVRCDWTSSAVKTNAVLYTLPYTYDKSSYCDSTCSKSTCPNEIDFWSYDRVQTVEYVNNRPNLANNFVTFRAQFPNIHYLNIIFLFNNNILSVYPSLNHLTRLVITANRWFEYSQLQALLDRVPHLYLLKLCKFTNVHMILSQIRSTSIRRLELIENNACDGYFDDVECTALVNSSVGLQCEILLIDITNRNIILDLFDKLSNLRMLNIRCKHDKWDPSQPLDKLVLWLHDYLPSTCLIDRDAKHPYYIQIWIDCKRRLNVNEQNLS